jgi:TRAP-type C4-dicarboxylate transport system substrate-binding protein
MQPSTALTRRRFAATALAAGALAGFPAVVRAEPRTLSFGYDEPHETGYGFFADRFGEKLAELSKGALKIQQYPNAQLGTEPEMAQKVRTGDLDFTINSTGNAAAISPQAGVLSLEYLFSGEPILVKSVLDPGINDTFRKLIAATVTGANALGIITLGGLRNMYAKFPITGVADIKGKKVRVQATKTEDTFMTAYGAIPVHMPFTQVYTSLQTGVVEVAENGNDVYLSNKHYEVAPVLSLTQHEANTNVVFVSSKTAASFDKTQQGWMMAAFEYAQHLEVPRAIELDHGALDKLKGLGVQIVTNVNKTSFSDIAHPIVDQQGQALGPFSQQVIKQIRALQ